jgi:hypothetical protein
MTTYDVRMSDPADVRLGSIVGWMRLAVGVGMIAAPAPVIRLGSGETPSGDMVLMTRTVGVRDLALGMGTVMSCRPPSAVDARRWVALGLCSDLLDFVVGATSARSVGRRGALIAALAPVLFLALDVAALTRAEVT